MAEAASSSSSGTTMAESDIIAMKETLRAQQQLLQKLYAELDVEREASATAASEALDMILRLQGEKAAVKMEARQYERMAEEKIEHAETTLEIFEELMFQKDMEIASLEFQVQALKEKLESLGYDSNVSEFEHPETQMMYQRNDEQHQNGENGQNQNETVRRLSSLPPIPLNRNNMRVAARKRERSPSPLPPSLVSRMEDKTEQEVMDLAKKTADSSINETLDSYWEQIKKLNEKVKVISDCKEKEGGRYSNLRGRRYRSCSIYSRGRSKTPEIKLNREEAAAIADPSCSGNVHDVFEVPQTRENHRVVGEYGKKNHLLERLSSIEDNRLTKPDPEEPEKRVDSLFRYDSGKLMKILSTNMETKLHSPRDNNNNNNDNSKNNKITCMFGQKKELGMGVECNGQAEFHMLSKRIERLEKEKERVSTRQEITHEGDGEEQLRLLKEILTHLKSIQKEMRRPKPKKAPPKDDVPLGPLQEAMLYFWL